MNANRGMFGYEGEGFDFVDDAEVRRGHPYEGWNIGRDDGPRPSYRGKGPKNYQRTDEHIREDVCERLTEDDGVDATDIEVAVENGIVTLTGTVHERYAKRRAEDVAESVSGVTDVQNSLRVARG